MAAESRGLVLGGEAADRGDADLKASTATIRLAFGGPRDVNLLKSRASLLDQ
jgi:hypothetical protein